ncbi:MAG: phosphoribosylanthranilate isomerase [Desulfovibrionales bacterium]|nr:phosphoribosylanthranilate isomerase [Desulfovibrionales bacterium]
MRVQIYTMQTPEEAKAIVELGVEHIGVTPSNHNLPGEVSFETARKIFAAVGDDATKISITVDSDLDKIVEMAEATKPDVVHICGRPLEAVPVDAVRELRRRLPGMKFMIAIPVNTETAVDLALEYEPVADFLILDTDVSHINGIGASGETHDWNVSKRIVDETNIPVILAGGLCADNVQDAIEKVQPWAVDSLTHTNKFYEDGTFIKDIDKVKAFVEAAKRG